MSVVAGITGAVLVVFNADSILMEFHEVCDFHSSGGMQLEFESTIVTNGSNSCDLLVSRVSV